MLSFEVEFPNAEYRSFDIFLIVSSSSSFRVSVILISTTMLLRAGVEEETWLSVLF
jgi:hypothetical protein